MVLLAFALVPPHARAQESPLIVIHGYIRPTQAHPTGRNWYVTVRQFKEGRQESDFQIKADDAGNFTWRGPVLENGYYYVMVNGGRSFHNTGEIIESPGEFNLYFVMQPRFSLPVQPRLRRSRFTPAWSRSYKMVALSDGAEDQTT